MNYNFYDHSGDDDQCDGDGNNEKGFDIPNYTESNISRIEGEVCMITFDSIVNVFKALVATMCLAYYCMFDMIDIIMLQLEKLMLM